MGVAAVMVVAIGLAACGDDSAGDSTEPVSGEAAEISALITRHYESPSCDDLTDDGRVAFGHPAPDSPCAKDIASQEPETVEVSDIEVAGDRGTAVGGGFKFDVVKVGGEWKIDGGE